MSFNRLLGIAQRNSDKTGDAFIGEVVDISSAEVEILSLGNKKHFHSYDKVALNVSTVDGGKVKVAFDRYDNGTFSPTSVLYFSDPDDEDGYVQLNGRGLAHHNPKLGTELAVYGMRAIESRTKEIEEKKELDLLYSAT